MTLEERIASRLRQYRQASGLTQTELANRVGAHTQQIYRYESGGSRIPAAHLVQISQSLGRPLEDFYQEGQPMSHDDEDVMRDLRVVASLVRGLPAERRQAVIDLLRAMAAPEATTSA